MCDNNQIPDLTLKALIHSFTSRAVQYFLLILLSLGISVTGHAQDADTMTIDVTKVRFSKGIQEHVWFTSRPKMEVTDSEIPQLQFRSDLVRKYNPRFPDKLIEKDIFLKIVVDNSSDSIENLCFLPAFFCRNIKIFKASPGDPSGTLTLLPDSMVLNSKYAGVRMISLQPHEKSVYYCRFNFVRTNVNSFTPRLIESDYLDQWVLNVRNRDRILDIFTYVVSGILLLMIFYSLAVYLQNRNKEFIYYAIYTFFTAILLFLKSYLNSSATGFNYFYEEYLDFMILCGSVLSYLVFVRRFVNTPKNHPGLDRILQVAKVLLIALCIIFSMIYFLTGRYIILSIMENYVIKFFFFLTGILFIVYSFKKKDTLLNYLAAGNTALIVFSVISQGVIVFKWRVVPSDTASIFNRAMLYYEIGLVLELGFFLSGLAYKNRRDIISRVKERERLKLENERKEFEKQMAVMAAKQEERDRISADMHDELGSGVTVIRLMSEIVKSRMQDATIVPELEKISSSANDLLGKMNTIIWTMKSSNDTLESLVAYIRAHAIEYFDSTPIDCAVNVPHVIPQVDVSGEKRRNIFMSVKEALNNAMKHSQASRIQIDILMQESRLVIKVADNGVGIETEKLRRFGNGLNNMRKRMENIEGAFKIENNGSCTLIFEAPL
jgi:signal transduction histidine kinase